MLPIEKIPGLGSLIESLMDAISGMSIDGASSIVLMRFSIRVFHVGTLVETDPANGNDWSVQRFR